MSAAREREDEFEESEIAGAVGGRAAFRHLMAEVARRGAWPGLLGGLALVALATAASLLEPLIIGFAIDQAILPRDPVRLRQWVVIAAIAVIVRIAATIGQGYAFEAVGQRVAQDLRLRLAERVIRQPMATFDRHPAGRLLTRLTNDVAGIGEMFSAGLVTMLSNLAFIAGILIWLLNLDWRLGLWAGGVFPIVALSALHFGKLLSRAYRDARAKLSRFNAALAESLQGMRVVQLFGREAAQSERLGRINAEYTESQTGAVRIYAVFQPTITIAAAASTGLVLYHGGLDVSSGRISVGTLVTVFAYVLSLFQPLRELAEKWNVFLSGMASAERVYSILSWPTEPRVDAAAERPFTLRGDLVFENVWFAYNEPEWVLRDLSFRVRAGERVGIVGHTGAGKSSLLALLMRFYEPQRGRILLDGRDLREYDRRELRRAIGLVPQEPFLFRGTTQENLTLFGTSRRPFAEIEAEFPELTAAAGFPQAATAERGSNLSVGQRQILAFARTWARAPSLWILDEATANVDSHTERRLQALLDRSARGQTTLVVAHRLATLRGADRILVLHHGALVEEGSHRELVARDGVYAKLDAYHRAQAAAVEAGWSAAP